MTIKMPRGALPISRNDLAAAEPYRPEPYAEVFVPSGLFPTPGHELAAAKPYRPSGVVPELFLAWPERLDFWGNSNELNSIWAEEGFAKACAQPQVFNPPDVVLSTARLCGYSNFAEFMQARGFQIDGKAYRDGPFSAVDWTNEATLRGAIAAAGPVKIGVTSASLTSAAQGEVTPGTSGWAICGLPGGQPDDHCASLCGYGPLAALVDLFKRHGVDVNLPSGMPTGFSYAMFTRGSIGIVDHQSLMNITGEAWVRNPTTIVKDLAG